MRAYCAIEGFPRWHVPCFPTGAMDTDLQKGSTTMSAGKQDGRSPVTALRRRLNMTQEEFAHTIGVTVSTVNRWENGHIEPSRLARKAMETLMAQVPDSSGAFEQPAGLSAKES
jgi:DNA-binding transcriptional regulator YiaG